MLIIFSIFKNIDHQHLEMTTWWLTKGCKGVTEISGNKQKHETKYLLKGFVRNQFTEIKAIKTANPPNDKNRGIIVNNFDEKLLVNLDQISNWEWKNYHVEKVKYFRFYLQFLYLN